MVIVVAVAFAFIDNAVVAVVVTASVLPVCRGVCYGDALVMVMWGCD